MKEILLVQSLILLTLNYQEKLSFLRMNRGQKELLMTRIQGLPRFNTLTKIPDLTPRQYTAQQLNAFARNIKIVQNY